MPARRIQHEALGRAQHARFDDGLETARVDTVAVHTPAQAVRRIDRVAIGDHEIAEHLVMRGPRQLGGQGHPPRRRVEAEQPGPARVIADILELRHRRARKPQRTVGMKAHAEDTPVPCAIALDFAAARRVDQRAAMNAAEENVAGRVHGNAFRDEAIRFELQRNA